MRFFRLLSAVVPCFVVACSSQVSSESTGSSSSSSGTGGTTTTHHTSTTVTTGQGGNGPDIGQPSTTYPAPHPAAPQVVSSGGHVLADPVLVPVFFQGESTTNTSYLTTFFATLGGNNSYWAATTSEYGIGHATGTPAVMVNETPTGTIDDSAIQSWLAGKLNGDDPLFPKPDANTLYVIYYPAGVTITLPDGQGGSSQSCIGFGGYHGQITLDAAHGSAAVAYSVIPRCGTFAGFDGVDALTVVTSHEIIEAASDPFVVQSPAYQGPDNEHFYWAFALYGGELGDMCAQDQNNFQQFTDPAYALQRTWSNKSAKAGHNPCVPIPQGEVYFNAAPVLNDTINIGQGFNIKGAHIPIGESKTIDIKLFSDASTNGPFDVQAYEPMLTGGGQHLDFSFDATSGENGQTLHLTITANTKSAYGVELFVLRSRAFGLGNNENTWVGIVGN